MNQIAKENRLESYLGRPVQRREQILTILQASPEPLTARQILARLGMTDMNSVRPRLTELCAAGRVQIVGKAVDDVTGKSVSLFAEVHPCRTD